MREPPEKTEWHSRTNPGLSGLEEAVRQRSLLFGRSVIPTLCDPMDHKPSDEPSEHICRCVLQKNPEVHGVQVRVWEAPRGAPSPGKQESCLQPSSGKAAPADQITGRPATCQEVSAPLSPGPRETEPRPQDGGSGRQREGTMLKSLEQRTGSHQLLD